MTFKVLEWVNNMPLIIYNKTLYLYDDEFEFEDDDLIYIDPARIGF